MSTANDNEGLEVLVCCRRMLGRSSCGTQEVGYAEMKMDLPTAAIVLPIGPGKDTALDTLESVEFYCPEPHEVVIIDDCTGDGTYEALLSHRKPNWHILRNPRPMGRNRLVHTLCRGFEFVVSQTSCRVVLRLDQDALLIKPGIITDALAYAASNPDVGLFGVYETDYDRARSFEYHDELMKKETRWFRSLVGLRPSWTSILALAQRRGYQRGENVFGGAYFVTWGCLNGMRNIGALDVPFSWHSKLMEDVYFSMAAVAAGFKLGHFAAPNGPLCLDWQGLPYPATQLDRMPYKVVHSVDKGKNTGPDQNEGMTARQVFKSLRHNQLHKFGVMAQKSVHLD